jgi:hypothetical protein
VLVGGEAGIGKSRLARELAERIAEEPHTWLECRAAPDSANSAFYPIIDLIDRMLDPRREAKPDGKVDKLEALLSLYGFDLAESMPLFAPLLSISLPQRWAPLDVSPQKKRELTRNAVLSLLFEMAEKQPVALVIEDLHWADPSTVELLGQLVGEVGSARVLAIFTARPEFSPPWPGSSVLPLQLGRFGRAEIEQLAAKVTGGRALPAEVMEVIAGRTDGVPLFVEELCLTVIEAGALVEKDGAYALAKPLSEVAIPATLRDSLVARLDRLGRAKETAQVASAIGREFTFELLRAVSPLEGSAAQEDLDKLVAAELVFRRRRAKSAAYIFKHALVRDAAYDSMLKRSRVEVHARIAKALVDELPDVARERPELVAHHLAAAEQKQEAIGYAQQAAMGALGRSAYAEAISHAKGALAWLPAVEDERARTSAELGLNAVICPAIMSARGWHDPDILATAERSLRLADALGDDVAVLTMLWTLWVFHHLGGSDRPLARSLAERLLAVAAKIGDASQEVAAHTAMAHCLWIEGDYAGSEPHFQRVFSLHDPDRDRGHAAIFGQDTLIWSRSSYALSLLNRGFPDQALALAESNLTRARAAGHAGSLGIALLLVLSLHRMRGEIEAIPERFGELKALAERFGLPAHLAYASVEICAATGNVEVARQVLAALEGFGSEMGLSHYRTIVSQALSAAGQHDAAYELMHKSRVRSEEIGERYHLARMLAVEGELLLARDPAAADAAEACFRRALDVAREQGVRLQELEAATALHRFLRSRGRAGEGSEVLKAAYAAFTEGRETKLLREARALLDQGNEATQ